MFAEAWHANNTGTPELGGQLMHLIEAPNRYGLPAFYTLHVWAWKPNRTGAFVNWHSDVSCEQFDGEDSPMPATIYRAAVFLLSIVCYGVFLLVFLYLLAFLGNLQIRRCPDSPAWYPYPSTWAATWVQRHPQSRWISACCCSSACSIP